MFIQSILMTRFSSLHFITNGSTKNNKKNLIKIKRIFFLYDPSKKTHKSLACVMNLVKKTNIFNI